MIVAANIEALIERDALAPLQKAIVATLKVLNTGVNVEAHPGKVDLSEIVQKKIVNAPGIGIGWSRVRNAMMADGHFCLTAEWTAYIVAESRVVAGKRVEKEVVGLAIGARLLEILADPEASLWDYGSVLPVEDTPKPELKPFFTIKDQAQGMALYTVTWSQTAVNLGSSVFPAGIGHYDEESGIIGYDQASDIEDMARFIPAPEEPEDA